MIHALAHSLLYGLVLALLSIAFNVVSANGKRPMFFLPAILGLNTFYFASLASSTSSCLQDCEIDILEYFMQLIFSNLSLVTIALILTTLLIFITTKTGVRTSESIFVIATIIFQVILEYWMSEGSNVFTGGDTGKQGNLFPIEELIGIIDVVFGLTLLLISTLIFRARVVVRASDNHYFLSQDEEFSQSVGINESTNLAIVSIFSAFIIVSSGFYFWASIPTISYTYFGIKVALVCMLATLLSRYHWALVLIVPIFISLTEAIITLSIFSKYSGPLHNILVAVLAFVFLKRHLLLSTR